MMNINSVSSSQELFKTNETGQRPPPPPPGEKGLPPGLNDAVSSLSDEEQAEVNELFSSLSPDQHDQLKSVLDSMKSDAQNMSSEDVGSTFLAALQSIAGTANTQSNSASSDSIIDTYA